MTLRPLARTPVRAALAAVALALALPALATTYKWVDAGGRVVYSDQPPTGGQKFEVVGNAAPPDNPNATREMANKDAELRKLYRGLWASEHGHYRTFIQLAEQILPKKEVATRWDQMLDAEAKLIQSQPPGPRMHGGIE